jgi:ABC-2 type transport system permease protein
MPESYSQRKAFFAITRAALRSISKSPSSVIFTIAFPLIFILVFGFIGGGERTVNLALAPHSDTINSLYQELSNSALIHFAPYEDSADLYKKLEKGKVDVILAIHKKTTNPKYFLTIQSGPGARLPARQLKSLLQKIIIDQDPQSVARIGNLMEIKESVVQEREFKSIDFILPGQLGFSLLAASVFGTAFVFFNLRQGLVLKRFFATPVRREYIILAEGVARMVFQLLGALLIILIGWLFLHYTLVNGVRTIINMLVLCAIGILIFMSFGFIISGLAKSESTIPPLSNILTLPQFLLAGTFFPIEDFPKWMQPFSRALPLTYLNDALRKVAFEGASLWGVRTDVAVLLLWGVLGYFIAARLFKWE